MTDAREKAVERLADLFDAWHDAGRRGEAMLVARGNMVRDAEALLAEIGAVFVDPGLVEAVRTTRYRWENVDDETRGHGPDSPPWRKVVEDIARAERTLADAVLSQVEP